MLRMLPLLGMSLAFAFLLGLPGIQAQNTAEVAEESPTVNPQCSECCLGLFKTCTVEVEDSEAEAQNSCEISIAFSCDGSLPFLNSIPRLTNIFGSSNTTANPETIAAQETEACLVTDEAGCKCPCHPNHAKCSANREMKVAITPCTDSCNEGCTAIHQHPPTATAGFGTVGKFVVMQKECGQCVTMGKSECCDDGGLQSGSTPMDWAVKPVSYNEAIPVSAANSAELLQGLMQARVENAKLEARLESLQRQCEMMEELVMLRARNEMLEELASLRAENVELHVRLEMADRRDESTRQPSRGRDNRR